MVKGFITECCHTYQGEQFPCASDVTVLERSVHHSLHGLLAVLPIHHCIVTIRDRGKDGIGGLLDGCQHGRQLCTANTLVTMDIEHLYFSNNTTYTTVYHSIPQYITVYHSTPQCTTVHHSASMCTTIHHSVSQCITVYYSVSQYITVYHSISQHR